MNIKKIMVMVACSILIVCSGTIAPHAEGTGLPDDCNGDRYCEFLKNVRNSGKITKESAEDVFQNATDSDLYRFGSFLNAPLFDLADDPSIARNAWTKKWRDYFNQIKNGYLDTRYGTGFNFRGCLLFGGKYCEIPKNDPDYIYFSNPSGGTGSGGTSGSGGSTTNYRNTTVNNSYRNYYVGGTRVNNSYIVNEGDTHNYSIVNNQFNEHKITYYKTENNTYNTYNTNNYYQSTYNDYYYDITNNYFNYTLDDHSQISVSYDYNFSTVNVLSGGNTVSYKYYFELPDGRNSFNLREEDLAGIPLDYHVKNYDGVSDGSNVLGLYHFDGDLSNSAFGKKSISVLPKTVNYVNDESTHFSNALTWSPSTLQNHSINFTANGVSFVDFRFRPIIDNRNDFDISVNGVKILGRHPYTTEEVTYTTEKKQTTSTIENFVKTGYGSIVFTKDRTYWNYTDYFPYDDALSEDKLQSRLVDYCNSYDSKYLGKFNRAENVSTTADKIKKRVYCDLFTTQTVTQEVEVQVPHVKTTVNYEDTEFFSKLQAGAWNHLAFKKEGENYSLYLNGEKLSLEVPLSDFFNIDIRSASMIQVDELRILGDCPYVDAIGDSYTVSVMPYDTDYAYVLPDVEYNRTILIQSPINVAATQFGGKRRALSNVGDVFVSISDGIVDSVQQYNGADWISVPASVYNSDLNKWVPLVGHLIIDGLVSSGSGGASTGVSGASEGFLTKKFKEVIDAIKGIKFINKENFNETINNDFTLDFETTNNNYKSIENKVKENQIYQFKERHQTIVSALQSSVDKAASADPIISIPDIKVGETVFIPATSFNFATVFADDSMSRLLTLLHTIIRAWVYISISLLWYRKLLAFFRK